MGEGGEGRRREDQLNSSPMSEHVVYRCIRRPDAGLVARAAALPVSDIYESLANRDAGLMSPRMRPLVPGARIAGPAITVRCAAGDNLMMHKGLLLAEPGDVLVVAAGEPSGAQWGTLAAVYAQHKGLAGVVVHGCVRDVDDVAARRFPVWATAISPAHPNKQAAGSVNVPVRCDGVTVHPGDLVCADGDGVVVVPHAEVAAAVEKAERRQRHEAEIAAAILTGQSLFDLHNIGPDFARSGVRVIDGCWEDGA
jgi:4-hydroxy-4-methyl-2-oxoglutarate aldolase